MGCGVCVFGGGSSLLGNVKKQQCMLSQSTEVKGQKGAEVEIFAVTQTKRMIKSRGPYRDCWEAASCYISRWSSGQHGRAWPLRVRREVSRIVRSQKQGSRMGKVKGDGWYNFALSSPVHIYRFSRTVKVTGSVPVIVYSQCVTCNMHLLYICEGLQRWSFHQTVLLDTTF